MSRRKKLIQDIHLSKHIESCFVEKIPLTPQSKELLFGLAKSRVGDAKDDEKPPLTVALLNWVCTKEGKIAKRKAYDIAADKSYTAARSWLIEQFLVQNPLYRTKIGRPKGSINQQSRVLLKAGELIAEMLNRCAHDL